MSFCSSLKFSEERFCQQVCSCISDFFNKEEKLTLNLNLYETIQEIKSTKISIPLLKNKVLIFPPTDAKGRFFIHKCVEFFPYLTSISIGSAESRRVIVFANEESTKLKNNSNKSLLKNKDNMSSPRNGGRRPDKAIYVPKHRRNGSPIPQNVSRNENRSEEFQKHSKSSDKTNNKTKLKASCVYKDQEKNEDEPVSEMDQLELETDLYMAYLKCATCISEKFTKTIVDESLQFLKENSFLLKSKVKRKDSPRAQVHQSIVIQGVATNCVNLAIENAIQLLKITENYEKTQKSEKKKLSEKNDHALSQNNNEKSNNVLAGASVVSNEVIDERTSDEMLKIVRKKGKSEIKKNKNSQQNVSNNREAGQIDDSSKLLKNKKQKSKTKEVKKKENEINDPLPSKDKVSKKTKTKQSKNQIQESKTKLQIEEKRNILPSDMKDTEENEEEIADDWDSNWTEDGECLNEEMKNELSLLSGIKDPIIEKAQGIDYLNFTPTKNIELDEGEFGHVLELFDFSPDLQTQDIYNALSSAGVKDYNLTWVDDTHVLAVFGSQSAAHSAMKAYVPVLQMRQVVAASRASRIKARDLKDCLLPYKKRPESTGMVARNLVAGALGIRTNVSKEQRLKEKEMLKEAREKKRKKKTEQRDIWENPDT